MTTGRAPRLPRTERGGGDVPPDVAPNAVEDGGSEQCEATTDDAQAQRQRLENCVIATAGSPQHRRRP